MFVIFSLCLTILCFAVLWVENVWEGFFQMGPPLAIGNLEIQTWNQWWIFVGLLILYQCSNVYMEETMGRKIEREHIRGKRWSGNEIFRLACYNLYKWFGTILHILVAVTRLDVWLAIAVVDTFARTYMWYAGDGRAPRLFSL